MNSALACESLLTKLQKVRTSLNGGWVDCDRLCKRCEIFAQIVAAVRESSPVLDTNKNNERLLLSELEKTLRSILSFVYEFSQRTTYQGITEYGVRQAFIGDIAKFTHQITRLSTALSLPHEDIDTDTKRKEDLEDVKLSFQHAVLTVLDEISTNVTKNYIQEFENNISQLLQDIRKHDEIVEKTLVLLKHIPLSMMETRTLKLDIKRLVSIVNTRRGEILAQVPPSPDAGFTKPQLSLQIPTELVEPSYSPIELNNDTLGRLLYNPEFSEEDIYHRQQILSEMFLPYTDITPINVQIGKGGFSDIYLGTFQFYNHVAIKCYRPNVNLTLEQQRRGIENEVIILKYLGSYPSIVQFHGFVFNEPTNQLDLIFELAPYGSLASILYDQSHYPEQFPLNLSIAWLYDIADALRFLHAKQMKHRDLKAENCLVFEKFRVKLSDFGPTKQHLARDQAAESRVGTFAFMAPEIRMGGKSEYASDMFSFAMTAIQIFTRQTPRIDDFKGQITAALSMISFPSVSIQQKLSEILFDCVKFEINSSPTTIRPTAKNVVDRLGMLLDGLDGDPREKIGGGKVAALEGTAKKLQSKRLQPAGFSAHTHDPLNANYGYIPQPPASPASVKGFGVPIMGSSSSGHTSPRHSANMPGALPMPPDGMTVATPGRYGASSGASVFSIGGVYDQFQFDADDRMVLARFVLENTSVQDHTVATRFADILVKNGVSNPEVLRRRVKRNRNYLLDIGIDESICREIYAVLTDKPEKVESPRYSIVKQHQVNPLYAVNNRMSLGLHSYAINEEAEMHQSIARSTSNGHGINITIQPYATNNLNINTAMTMDQSVLSGASASFYNHQDMEDRLTMIQFLRDDIRCTQPVADEYANMIFDYGICNVEVLKRRVMRNAECLFTIGLDEKTANEMIDFFAIDGTNGIMQGNVNTGSGLGLSMYQMNRSFHTGGGAGGSRRTSPSNTGNGKKFSRRGSSVIGGGNTNYMPTEIARYYYDATQCYKQDAYFKLIEFSEQGDQLALGFLMRIYATGQANLPKDVAQAQQMGGQLLPWLKEAMESGSELITMYAKYLIGVCYSEGLGTNLDHREAMRWYRQSAEQGYAGAQAMVGFCYFFGKGVNRHFDEAVKYYRQAAEQGYAGAQCNLGLCYEHGYGVAKNAEEAFHWYLLAADQGEAAALYNVGYCFEKGIGTMVNVTEAFQRYKQSAELGYTNAEYNLGLCYYTGIGTPQDLPIAVQWLHQAASVKQYAAAQCKLGLCYENGHGVDQNYAEATRWYQTAANQGYAPAIYYLGFAYFAGLGVSRNIEHAVQLYQQAAEKGYPAAQNNLGFCYFNGTGITKNHKLAVQWYRKAAEQGYAAAQYNLGYCYEKGFGVSMKLHEVMKWYRLAADNGNDKAKKALTKLNA